MESEEEMKKIISKNKRLEREQLTVEKMIDIYCRKFHHSQERKCTECEKLWEYSNNRIIKCQFGATKPVCAKCKVHCYKPEMREAIKKVMRYSGPRMLLRHPVLTFYHITDSRREP